MKKKILHLTLKKKPFELTFSGEKKVEYRVNSKWILSRLVDKNYDCIKFVNGYGNDKPFMIVEFLGWGFISKEMLIEFSNGFEVKVKPNDLFISLGKIIKHGNINSSKLTK